MNDMLARHRDKIAFFSVMALVAFAGWNSINNISGVEPYSDPAIFINIGFHILKGKVLYLDVFDIKPPGIFFLNALALGLGDGTVNAIRLMERLFAMAGLVSFYLIIRNVFRHDLAALAGTFIFGMLFYSSGVLSQDGNVTEEYGAIFCVIGILFSVIGAASDGKRGLAAGAMSGFFFSLAVFTKQPFLLSSVPWFFYYTVFSDRPIKRAGAFVSGAAIPFIALIVYFASNNAIASWLEVTAMGMAYTKYSQSEEITNMLREMGFFQWLFDWKIYQNYHFARDAFIGHTVGAGILFVVGLIGAFYPAYLKKYRYFPLFAVIAAVMDFMGTMISDLHIRNYYLQMVPSFALTCACGIGFIGYMLSRTGVKRGMAFAVVIFAALFIFDHAAVRGYTGQIMRKGEKFVDSDPVAKYIREHSQPNDTLWAPYPRDNDQYLYVKTGRLSPVKFAFTLCFFFYREYDSRWGDFGGDRMLSMQRKLFSAPPKFLYLPPHSWDNMLGVNCYNHPPHITIPQWIAENYIPLPQPELGGLFERKF